MREPAGKPCIRCLIRDLPDGEQLAELIRERNELLPEGKRAGEALYRARLDICRACPSLNRGTCALCGCYVEIRAAEKARACPDVPGRW